MYEIINDIKVYRNPEVYLAGYSRQASDLQNYIKEYSLDVDISSDGLSIPEIAGRHCYMSFNKNKSNKDYLMMLYKNKHMSVLEHFHASIIIRGISRGFTHEMVRHRLFSYSQCSTRYVNASDMCIVIPPQVKEIELFTDIFKRTLEDYNKLLPYGKSIAREVLPIFMEAPIIVSGNLRCFIEMMEKRSSNGVASQFRSVVEAVEKTLSKIVYNTFFAKETSSCIQEKKS